MAKTKKWTGRLPVVWYFIADRVNDQMTKSEKFDNQLQASTVLWLTWTLDMCWCWCAARTTIVVLRNEGALLQPTLEGLYHGVRDAHLFALFISAIVSLSFWWPQADPDLALDLCVINNRIDSKDVRGMYDKQLIQSTERFQVFNRSSLENPDYPLKGINDHQCVIYPACAMLILTSSLSLCIDLSGYGPRKNPGYQ